MKFTLLTLTAILAFTVGTPIPSPSGGGGESEITVLNGENLRVRNPTGDIDAAVVTEDELVERKQPDCGQLGQPPCDHQGAGNSGGMTLTAPLGLVGVLVGAAALL